MNMNDNERGLLAENESLRLELAGLERENERLRKALRAVIDYVPPGFISPMDDEDSLNYRAIARAALTTPEQEPTGFDRYFEKQMENPEVREAYRRHLAPRDFDEVVLYLDQARRGVLTDAYAVEELLLRLGEHATTPDQETP